MDINKILGQVAEADGVSIEEVKKEMQAAISAAYQNPSDDGGRTAARQKEVPCRGEIPTPEEFIRYAAWKLKKHMASETTHKEYS